MGNTPTLRPAPPFTVENAAEKGRLGGIQSGLTRRNKAAARNKPAPASNPSEAQNRAAAQVEKVLTWMERTKDQRQFAQLAACLDRLWNKAFPTQGAAKPRNPRRDLPAFGEIETPQGETQQIKQSAENPQDQTAPA